MTSNATWACWATIARVSPLLGLLGTVTGMIRTFKAITVAGVGDPTAMAGGIAEALITTAAGLIIAVPALMAYRYLRGRVDALVIRHGEGIAQARPGDRSRRLPDATRTSLSRRGQRRVKFTPRRSEEPDLNMTSLIDVVLLLLIFFMMSTRFVDESRLAIRLPEAGVEPDDVGAARHASRSRSPPRAVTASTAATLINNSPDTLVGGAEPRRRAATGRCP